MMINKEDFTKILFHGNNEDIHELINLLSNKETKMNQNDYLTQVRARRVIVGSVDSTGIVSIATQPVVHLNVTSALQECGRLAKLSPGKAYVALQMVGGAVTSNVTTF